MHDRVSIQWLYHVTSAPHMCWGSGGLSGWPSAPKRRLRSHPRAGWQRRSGAVQSDRLRAKLTARSIVGVLSATRESFVHWVWDAGSATGESPPIAVAGQHCPASNVADDDWLPSAEECLQGLSANTNGHSSTGEVRALLAPTIPPALAVIEIPAPSTPSKSTQASRRAVGCKRSCHRGAASRASRLSRPQHV